jgi:hypothetical protein
VARLTMAQRRKLPKSAFAVPSKAPGPGSFPIPDRKHAIAAKREEHNAAPANRPRIERMANRKLGKRSGLQRTMGSMRAKGAFKKASGY